MSIKELKEYKDKLQETLVKVEDELFKKELDEMLNAFFKEYFPVM